MKNKRHTFAEKEAIFKDILHELNDRKIKTISHDEIIKMFSEKGCFIRYKDFIKLNIKGRVREIEIPYGNVLAEEKKLYFLHLLKKLKADGIEYISNRELIDLMKEEYGVGLRETEITSLGFRTMLNKHGIKNKQSLLSRMPIINQVIKYVTENNIEINNVTQLHKYALQFGNISRATLDNHLDYIQQYITIKNMRQTKRIKALDMTDEEVMSKVALYYVKKNVSKLTASEFRKHTNSRYRTIDISIIKKHRNFFAERYGLEIISIDSNQENQNYHLENILEFLKTNEILYTIQEVEIIDENIVCNTNKDVFIYEAGLIKKLKSFWDEYTILYIRELAKNRINVKNAFLIEGQDNLKVDTEKKEIILLSHEQLNIESMTLLEFIKLTMLTHKASHKAYGIHMQNMYIGFLVFLYSKNQLIFPFSYLYDVCYTGRKIQTEIELFLAEHPINKQLLQAIKEKRLNIGDDKYRRIFQLLLLTFSSKKSISIISYEDLSTLRDRSRSNFNRVVKILNTLGATIVIDQAKRKYTERYDRYRKGSKYSKLIELFDKAMNRAYKLGDYSKEENIYKNWSTQYTHFFDFIEQHYSNTQISESFLYQIFDYPDEESVLTYQEYVQSQELSSSSKEKRFTPLIVAFSNSNYLSLKNIKDKKPIFRSSHESTLKKQKRSPITNPIVLTKLEDILRNRPPKSNYFSRLNIDSIHTDWWKHYDKVAPFEPLILLMHLYIPARGINFRLVDRNSFLVKNEQGVTTGYHFTHDKNKKRKKPYIAPNIWGDDLGIIEDFIKYSKIHFNVLKPIKYDKQNPKGIFPLFPNSKGTGFYTESQHMKYWKRVLLKAQVELNNEHHKEDILLIYPDINIEMPTDPDAVDHLSQAEIEKFNIRYDLHSLRHTGATRYANAGMPMGLVALLTGHINMNVLQSVYVELDVQKMIAIWQSIQHIEIADDISLAKAGESLIGHVQQKAKEIFSERSPEKLLVFLEKEKFITIGAYVSEDMLTRHTLEDFSKIDPMFWSFRNNGICTSPQCPQGLENRCSLCPSFMTSPVYSQKIVMQINLQNFRLSKYINMIIENREQGNPQNNENIRKSALLEAEEMLGWTELLRAIDESRMEVDNDQVSTNQKALINSSASEDKPIFSLAPIANSNHALLRLVYDSLESKEFGHESLQDASEKMVGKIIRYAARNGRYAEIDGADKYSILKWFYPVYQDVRSLERNGIHNDKLLNILNQLSDKPLADIAYLKEIKSIEEKGKR